MPDILISNIMMLKERDRFQAQLEERGYTCVFAEAGQFLSERVCLDYAGRIDGWLAGDDHITRAVLSKASPRLKVISKWGTGLDSIDLDAAKDMGIPVFNAPGAFAITVAEYALGYMLALARKIVETDTLVRQDQWPKPQTRELYGQTLGLIGFGAIGSRIGTLAQAFGMRVIFFDPHVKAPTGKAQQVDFPDIQSEADFLCIACALTKSSHHLIDGAFLKASKPTLQIINVARGPIIEEAALINALADNQIAGCALDVFEEEPLPSDSPLRQMNSVILGSHNANNGQQAVEAVHGITLANLDRVLGKSG